MLSLKLAHFSLYIVQPLQRSALTQVKFPKEETCHLHNSFFFFFFPFPGVDKRALFVGNSLGGFTSSLNLEGLNHSFMEFSHPSLFQTGETSGPLKSCLTP